MKIKHKVKILCVSITAGLALIGGIFAVVYSKDESARDVSIAVSGDEAMVGIINIKLEKDSNSEAMSNSDTETYISDSVDISDSGDSESFIDSEVKNTDIPFEKVCEGGSATIFDSGMCTVYFFANYIRDHGIGKVVDDKKISGWSMVLTTPSDVMEIAVELDRRIPNNKSTMKGTVIYHNSSVEELNDNIVLTMRSDDVQVLFNSDSAPVNLKEVYQISVVPLYSNLDV